MAANGMSREDIGRELYISPWTVKKALDEGRRRLGGSNITQACTIAIARHLISIRDIGDEYIAVVAVASVELAVAA